MHSFPLTVVDNFFDNPDEVRSFALAQEYEKDPNGVWPGSRTKPLHILHPIFFEQVFNRLFSLFYSSAHSEVRWEVSALFQKVDQGYGSGWIHTDSLSVGYEEDRAALMSGIIYLTPNMPVDSGTSLYRLKAGILAPNPALNNLKGQHYLGDLTEEDVRNYREIHNSQYEETVKVGSVYNRLIAFESNQPHAAQNFFGSEDQSRLTLVFFVRKAITNQTPIQRMRHVL